MTQAPVDRERRRPRSAVALGSIGLAGLAVLAGLLVLGTWQLQRRAWKVQLIERVNHRVHAAPIAPPADWTQVSAQRDEYRHVRVGGVFLHDRETLVQAVTELGPGDWVVTPLRTDSGSVLLINRGFVPDDRRAPATRAAGELAGHVTVTGLVRMSEPKGGFLRANDPAAGRWYSRDVAAIAASHRLTDVAPYFIDADATPNPGGWPVGGLTVISFPNSHLVYALTWYGLALMVAAGLLVLVREERRQRAGEGGDHARGR